MKMRLRGFWDGQGSNLNDQANESGNKKGQSRDEQGKNLNASDS